MRNAYPALTLWQRELAAGVRTIHGHDALWRAACWEMSAKKHVEQFGDVKRSADMMAKARAIIAEAARQKRAA